MGEELNCERKSNIAHDRYALAVKRRKDVIGHLPQKLSRLCSLLLGLEIHLI